MILIETHTVQELPEKQRISDYLQGRLDSFISNKSIKKSLKKGLIKIDGEVAISAHFVKGGEKVEVYRPSPPSKKKLLKLKLNVVHEDDHIAIIEKPAGIPVSGNQFRTIERALPFNFKRAELPDDLPWPQPVHRLDYPTTGLLLCAKTHTSLIKLNQMFENRKVNKTYAAICIGEVPLKGKIESAIKGKEAQTHYSRIEKADSTKFGTLSLVELQPVTGRRHQLRIHMTEAGYPILGDKTYFIEGKVLFGKGLYLHASRLEFEHPETEELLQVTSELPGKFSKIFPNPK